MGDTEPGATGAELRAVDIDTALTLQCRQSIYHPITNYALLGDYARSDDGRDETITVVMASDGSHV